ncbi:tetratricopeptide repeat protein [Akkermansia glycaniphila]|uniref:Kinesin light chain signature n=1 Tax=Akkermansia glycaniphila TaxID=1679444 RepID=A0A1H6MK96_9BACT|nr:tetratricopeptide repeat protein [Akkermansia glycaniphila]SEH98014.1 kinesin light chain signature [Akkermansia glycaniphila]
MNNDPAVNNLIRGTQIGGNYIGRDCITNHYHQPSAPEPRGFIVTHTSDIKPTSHFMGRESELAHLRTNAEEGRKSILVSGMGGIGKTHICRRLFQEYHARHLRKETVPFRHIGYIQYDGNMDASLVSCLIYPKPADQAAQVEAAWRELALLADKGLLLFVDNVSSSIGDDPSLLKLCSLPSPVILTSRLKYFDPQNAFELYAIDSLPLEECRKLYLKITGDTPDHQQALDEILDIRAARHTLTVELLARTAASNEWSIPTLLDKLKSNGFRITYEDGDQTVALMDAYEKLFILSALNDAEINILEAFSLFPYLPLHKDTCTAWLLPDAGEKADGSIFQKLHRKGWLQHEKNAGYMIHPILSQFVRERQKPSWLRHSAVVAAVWQAIDIPDNGCRPFLPFSESLIAQLDEIPQQTNADLLNALGYTLHRIGAYTRALPLFEKALRIREDALGDSHPDTVISYNNLASLYNCQGDYTRAQPFYEKALQIREDALGECHPDTATSYNNLAGLYNSQGDDERAKSLYEKALRIREAALGDGHPDTAASYNNLALLYKNQENYAQAQTLYEKALRISEACLGENHPDTATSYNNLASLYDSQGDYTRAQPFYEKALRIREDAFGENHPDTAASYNNLASLYYGQDNYDKASPLFQKALNICRDILGEQHPTTQTILGNTIYCLYRQSGAVCSFEEWLEQQTPSTEE